jgi:hypothetical protein
VVVSRPYKLASDNLQETASLGILSLITALMTAFSTPLAVEQSILLGFLIFIPGAMFFVVIVVKRVQRVRRNRALQRGEKQADFAAGPGVLPADPAVGAPLSPPPSSGFGVEMGSLSPQLAMDLSRQ